MESLFQGSINNKDASSLFKATAGEVGGHHHHPGPVRRCDPRSPPGCPLFCIAAPDRPSNRDFRR